MTQTKDIQTRAAQAGEAARGQGVGARLVEDAQARACARGCGVLTVGAAADNAAAQRFYAQCGFEHVASQGVQMRVRLGVS